MALTNLQANITLDVYDHDGAKPSIKTIALDDNTRYVLANIRSRGEVYDIGSGATVQLIVIRPDKVGVQIAGQAQGIEIGQEDESVVTVYGAYAELDQAAIAVPGTLLGQFKITDGTQILRTQIFQILNGEALDSDTWAGDYDGYNLDELVADVAEAVEKVGDLETDVAQIKEEFAYKVTSTTIFCDDLEDGWYSNNNGQKYPNTESSSFKRSKNLIPVEEGALYVSDRTTRCTCFDKNGTFLTYITVYASTEKFARQTIPTGTTHVGLTATNAPSFTLTKVDASGVTGIEYPYNSKGCVHVESCWCNGNGGVYSTANLDMLVIPVEEGERWYVSNQADSNLLCLDGTGAKVTATYEARSPIGKIVPSGQS